MTHLLATISSHGLGHLGQSAPVLNALRRRAPGLRLKVVSTLPAERLRARIEGEFRLEARPLDFRFEMEDAFRVARGASAAAYRAFHARWDEQLHAAIFGTVDDGDQNPSVRPRCRSL